MRVISGRARGRKLKRVPGDTTRPIMDRVKESLFNILGQDVVGARWLDMFAGTGQVGIEALSRGAAEVVFVDKVRPAIQTIQGNLQITGLRDGATVVQADSFAYLRQQNFAPFDLVYVAPPQYQGLWLEALAILDERPSAFLTPDGVVVVQIDPKERQPLSLNNLLLYDERVYGNTQLLFFENGQAGD
ncbi:MAG: 16S rRNA (guanine(966)-N(2))-methyltransferase RsmD [Anaerolineales bacterium]|nr:16S rRNA (guanine(966)-N(2))-methyltransferase RsmD [Anaerolineales bacterium]